MGADADGCRCRWVQRQMGAGRWVQMQMGADADGCVCRWVHRCRILYGVCVCELKRARPRPTGPMRL